MTWIATQTYHRDLLQAWITNHTPRIVLLNDSSSITNASTIIEILQREVPETAGYSRILYNPSAGSWDATQNRWEFAGVVATYTIPNDGTLQYDRVAVIGGLRAYGNRLVTTLNTGTNRLDFGGTHPFVNGDRVTVTADAGGTVPSALLSSGNPTTLFVVGADSTSIQVSATSGGSALSLTGGVSPIRVRSIDSSSLGFFSAAESVTFLPGQTRSIRILYNLAGNGINVEAA